MDKMIKIGEVVEIDGVITIGEMVNLTLNLKIDHLIRIW